MSSAILYSSEVLALATSLALYPLDDNAPLQGTARSKACGSTLRLGLAIDATGQITEVGLRAQACAIGQAAAAIFAGAAIGMARDDIARAEAELEAWLACGRELPAWAGLAAIAPARDYPARHGAIMLAWKAALDALPEEPSAL